MKPKLLENVIPLRISDEAIVQGVLEGDVASQQELLRRYGRLMAGVILNVLGPRDDLDDLLQETFLVIFRDMHKLREPGALKSWMVTIAVSRARNTLRGERRKWWLSFREPQKLPEPSSRPEEDEAMRAVYEALEQMKPDDRTIFALRYISQMTIPELADALEISASTTKRRLKAARAIFDRLVEGDPRLTRWLQGDAT